MELNLGKTFRKIRKSKHISITSLADRNISKSQISRFEREKSEISGVKLIKLLKKLHVSMDEFLISCENNTCNSFIELTKYISEQQRNQDFDSIKDLLVNSKYSLDSIERTMIKSIIYSLDRTNPPSDEELLQLTDYLFKVEKWGYYEIVLLGNCMRTISYLSFFTLTKEMLKSFTYSISNKTNKKLVAQLSINCLITSIEKKNISNSDYLVKKIEEILNDEFFYYEKTVFLYAQGYLEYVKGIKAKDNKMKQAIGIFKTLNEDAMLKYYTDHYNRIIGKS